VVGFDAAGTERWDAVDYRRPIALVLGGEGRGIAPARARASAIILVSLPLFGHVGSLNVSVAAASRSTKSCGQARRGAEPRAPDPVQAPAADRHMPRGPAATTPRDPEISRHAARRTPAVRDDDDDEDRPACACPSTISITGVEHGADVLAAVKGRGSPRRSAPSGRRAAMGVRTAHPRRIPRRGTAASTARRRAARPNGPRDRTHRAAGAAVGAARAAAAGPAARRSARALVPAKRLQYRWCSAAATTGAKPGGKRASRA
jgi:hypothetical protein